MNLEFITKLNDNCPHRQRSHLFSRCFGRLFDQATEQPAFLLTSGDTFETKVKKFSKEISLGLETPLHDVRDADADLVKQVFDAGRSFEDAGQASFFLLRHSRENRGDKCEGITQHMFPFIKFTVYFWGVGMGITVSCWHDNGQPQQGGKIERKTIY